MLTLIALTAVSIAADSSQVYRGSERELDVRAPHIEAPDIRIDGRLDEAAWRSAARLTAFTRYEPVENVAADEETEVLVFYSSDAIYFGIHAHDRRPDEIRATLAERDRSVFGDDWVRLMLDTFNDRRQAYIFYVNPLGIQTDGLWLEGGPRQRGGMGLPMDFSPDFIWESDGQVVEDGWVAEIRIPYVSLRFRESEVQDWGINIAREVKRTGYKQSWAPLTKNQASTLAQSGRLVELRGLRPRRLVEVNPVVTGKRVGELTEAGDLVHGDFERDYGTNMRVGLTANLVLDATINPDFSQVEADAGQIAVNERFALYFPEKRPFFLEGAEVFQTPQRLVYTRSIVDPAAGAKLTGKVGSFNVGYLGAVDDSPIDAESDDDQAVVNLFRIRRDIGNASTIGALYTDRVLTGGRGFNRVVGVDARVLFRGRYTLTTQLARSWTRAADSATTAGDPLVSLQVERTGRRLGWQLQLEDLPSDFHAESGFLRRLGDARVFGQVETSFYGKPGALLERWGGQLHYESYYLHDALWSGGPTYESEVQFQGSLSLRGRRTIRFILRDGYYRFLPDAYSGYAIQRTDGSLAAFPLPAALEHMWGFALMPNLQLTPWASLNGRFYYREVPIYVEASRGLELQFAPTLQLRPGSGLDVNLSLARSRIRRRRDDSLFSTADIPRLRLQYQFSRALFARITTQYSLESRAALRHPDGAWPVWIDGEHAAARNTGEFQYDVLFSYQPSPGTVVYLGWSSRMAGPDTYRLRDYESSADGLFLKLSYLYRL